MYFEAFSDGQLQKFESVMFIRGDLNIYRNYVTNLSGLNLLSTVFGSMMIYGNSQIVNLDELNSLRKILGDLHVMTNLRLETLQGLTNLEVIQGDIVISENERLTAISSFGTHPSLATQVGRDPTNDADVLIYGNSNCN